MRLVDKITGQEITPGTEVDPGKRGTFYLSGHDPNTKTLILFQEPGDGGPVYSTAAAIGAEWRS